MSGFSAILFLAGRAAHLEAVRPLRGTPPRPQVRAWGDRHRMKARLILIRTTDPSGRSLPAVSFSQRLLSATLFHLLGSNVLCSLATMSPGHRPHINSAYFSYSSQLDMYFLSHPESLHCRNLREQPLAAMTVFSSSQTWGTPDSGLQLFGRCALTRGAQAIEADTSYARRFPRYAKWRTDQGRAELARAYRFYRFGTSSIKLFDERTLGRGLFLHLKVIRLPPRD